ncbi:unnamed protein product [Clonostachys rosea]|uniref:Uncharacterized protein n=1 Tax=Bionectria ochroleuca TaxID=29856 RepID=A0ABY6TTH4_BIOOC|nr:unnamed protein product [Clonostachys rosea]
MFTPARRFSTAAKVYPSYLPHIPHSRRMPMPFRWFKPLAALVAVGLGARAYAVNARDRRTIAAAHESEQERRRQQNLMDVYGSRDSLEDLENAIRFYEKK